MVLLTNIQVWTQVVIVSSNIIIHRGAIKNIIDVFPLHIFSEDVKYQSSKLNCNHLDYITRTHEPWRTHSWESNGTQFTIENVG